MGEHLHARQRPLTGSLLSIAAAMALAGLVGFVLGGLLALATPKSSSLLAIALAVPLSIVAEIVFGSAHLALVKGKRREKALIRIALWAGIVIGCVGLWHFG